MVMFDRTRSTTGFITTGVGELRQRYQADGVFGTGRLQSAPALLVHDANTWWVAVSRFFYSKVYLSLSVFRLYHTIKSNRSWHLLNCLYLNDVFIFHEKNSQTVVNRLRATPWWEPSAETCENLWRSSTQVGWRHNPIKIETTVHEFYQGNDDSWK